MNSDTLDYLRNIPIRLGIVGCGAITEIGHLPACQQVNRVHLVALVDIDRDRAERLAHKYRIPQIETDYRALLGQVDAVIVATPPHLHAEQSAFFLEHGIPVLCEKPLATNVAECSRLVELATQNHVQLATGHVRRFFFYAEQIRALVTQGKLGQPIAIRADEGSPYTWPAYTDYAFRHAFSPGGVTLDLGLHLLDLFIWILGPIARLRYGDDAIGGVESNAEVEVEFANGAYGHLRLSRTCHRPNRLAVWGSRGWAQAHTYTPDRLTVYTSGMRRPAHWQASQPQTLITALASQLDDFLRSIVENRPPRTSGQEGLAAVSLVEQCYKQRCPLPQVAPIPGVIRWNSPAVERS